MILTMNKKFVTSLVASFLVASSSSYALSAQNAQEKSISKTSQSQKDGVQFSGYVQYVSSWGMPDASLKVGAPNEAIGESFSRMGIRRGRLKSTYKKYWASAVLQLDMTEKGVSLKDAYIHLQYPNSEVASLRFGVFDRPFGHEVSYSSSRRETPERSMVVQTIFPNERDLGGMLSLRGNSSSWLGLFSLNAGLFAGNGIKSETDSHLDFIGRLSAGKGYDNGFSWSVGSSLYYGGVRIHKGNLLEMNSDKQFVPVATPESSYATRLYGGIDSQLSFSTLLGMSNLRMEWIEGKQPGRAHSSSSPNSATGIEGDVYMRSFRGGYILLAQSLGHLPVKALLKYDWYDPNTRVSGEQIASSSAEMASYTWGMGVECKLSQNIRLVGYYEHVTNEISSQISDRKDDRATLMIQYQF